jgi:predicted extracellular nuclease
MPVGFLTRNNTVVQSRKMIQGFILIENDERFIFSINHFKAKSGTGTGKNADQGDGQGIFNYNRTLEAISLLQNMASYQSFYEDKDVLIMGDLNAYAFEDPIRTLTDANMYDLHRYFHADSSYSYVYGEQAGYLDHAIANDALIKQVTGMNAWHVNSDESDYYTYDKSNDQTVFRYSDHDPVLVGLRLDSTRSIPSS